MKKILFCIFLCSISMFSQKVTTIDSILHYWQKHKDSNPELAKSYIIHGIKLAENLDKKKKKAVFLTKLITYAGLIKNEKLAIENFEVAKKYCESINDYSRLAMCHEELGEVYLVLGNYDLMEKCYLSASENYLKAKDFIGIVITNINLASAYQKKGNYKKAIKPMLSSIKYVDTTQYLYIKTSFYQNLSNLYYNLDDFDKAIWASKKSLITARKDKKSPDYYVSSLSTHINLLQDIKKYEAARKYISELATLINNRELNSLKYELFEAKANERMYYKDYTEARKLLNTGILYCKKYNVNRDEVGHLENLLATIDIEEGKTKDSKITLQKLIAEAKEDGRINDLTWLYLNLSESYKQQKDFEKAHENLNLHLKYKDSVAGISQQKFLKDAEVKYDTQAKELKIQKNIAEISKKNNQIIIASIVALSFLLLGFLVYKNQKTKNQQQKQESVLKEALLKIEAENQLQEQRLGISKELHDNIGSQLTFVISAIDTLKQNYPSTSEKIDNQLENINAFTKNTITELRDTVWVMNTKDIDANALKERLLENIERAKLSNNNINFKVSIDHFEIENSSVALNLFRTIQEAVNNALKYAKATEISISIEEKDNQILAFVSDNGEGFELEIAKKGNGLKNMKKRIQTINGTFNIESQENSGTKINIAIPKNS